MFSHLSLQIVILFICVLMSALFSASETAITSLNPIKLEQMIESDIKGVKSLENLHKNSSKALSAILIGNNIVNIGASSLATLIAIELFGNKGLGIATGIMTLIILIFGEITPKSLATTSAENLALRLAPFVQFFIRIFSPIIFILDKLTGSLISILGGNKNKNKPSVTQDQLITMVNMGFREGVVESQEKDMIDNLFKISNYKVNDVMVTRTQVVAINVDTPIEEILDTIKEYKYSRMPVYEDTIDDIKGILHLKDLILLNTYERQNFKLKDHIRPARVIPEYKPIKKLFREMQVDNIHMAIVVDEYGGTEGIVTIEDLMEEIVGEIYDEFDNKEDEKISKISNVEYLIEGQTELDEIDREIGSKLNDGDYDTIAGFIIGSLGRIPKPMERIKYENLHFIVEKVDKNKIELVKLIIK